jgi:hypothetical protein
MKRNGEGKTTSYTVMQVPGSTGHDPSKFELYDLEKVCVRQVPYDEQPEFYLGSSDEPEAESAVQETQHLDW